MTNIFFTADNHFGHVNALKYCARPFLSVDEMNNEMVKRWNNVVSPQDTVYHLGDFSLCHNKLAKEIIESLNGTLYLIKGNHDKGTEKFKRWVWVKDYFKLKLKDDSCQGGYQNIILCHYAFETWDKMHRGAWSLHGHSHGNLKTPEWKKRLDVGVDCHDFTPISYDYVKEVMSKKVFVPIDHHGEI